MNMNEVLKQREQISALADGQLHGDDLAAAVEAVAMVEDARESWHVYHVVGDVLRSPDLAAGRDDLAFVARLRQRLQEEVSTGPRPLAPVALAVDSPDVLRPAANEPVFRWKLVAGFASLAAVAAIGWQLLGVGGPVPAGAQLAQTAPIEVRVAATEQGAPDGAAVMIRDARLDDLLAAHRQFGAASALQNPSGFLRNATFVEGRVD